MDGGPFCACATVFCFLLINPFYHEAASGSPPSFPLTSACATRETQKWFCFYRIPKNDMSIIMLLSHISGVQTPTSGDYLLLIPLILYVTSVWGKTSCGNCSESSTSAMSLLWISNWSIACGIKNLLRLKVSEITAQLSTVPMWNPQLQTKPHSKEQQILYLNERNWTQMMSMSVIMCMTPPSNPQTLQHSLTINMRCDLLRWKGWYGIQISYFKIIINH